MVPSQPHANPLPPPTRAPDGKSLYLLGRRMYLGRAREGEQRERQAGRQAGEDKVLAKIPGTDWGCPRERGGGNHGDLYCSHWV